MADKKQVRHSIKQLQRVKTWQLVVLLIISIFVSLTFLRLNNIGMIERRGAVTAADEAGNTDAVINRLYDLQRYVSSHMNTDMGKGLYLQASYKRDVQKAYDKAASDENPNGNIYKKAQEVCAPRFSSWSQAYLQCTFSELDKYPAASNLTEAVKLPSSNLYLHVFASPLWTPDFAGWSVVVTAVIALVILLRTISLLVLRLMLNRHYKSI
ncbi:MAG TPA: hypothetical protein PKC86_02660 [Candidatus Saccharibacteria bacterium]|nr:hypothetical protein [Candidatus Saccharibacteria bacterium]